MQMKKEKCSVQILQKIQRGLDCLFERCVLEAQSVVCLKRFVSIAHFLRPSSFTLKNIPEILK